MELQQVKTWEKKLDDLHPNVSPTCQKKGFFEEGNIENYFHEWASYTKDKEISVRMKGQRGEGSNITNYFSHNSEDLQERSVSILGN